MRILTVSILIIAFFFIGWQSKAVIDNKYNNSTQVKLNELVEKHGRVVYKSFYGIEEIRPYAIIQFDKTIEIYDNKWKSSSDYLAKLDQNDLNILNNKVANFIEESKDFNKESLLEKINSWCVTQKQIDLIIEDFGISEDLLFKALFDSELTNTSFDHITSDPNWSIDKLDASEKERIMQNAFNKISALNLSEQLIYYSKMYDKLSRMAVK